MSDAPQPSDFENRVIHETTVFKHSVQWVEEDLQKPAWVRIYMWIDGEYVGQRKMRGADEVRELRDLFRKNRPPTSPEEVGEFLVELIEDYTDYIDKKVGARELRLKAKRMAEEAAVNDLQDENVVAQVTRRWAETLWEEADRLDEENEAPSPLIMGGDLIRASSFRPVFEHFITDDYEYLRDLYGDEESDDGDTGPAPDEIKQAVDSAVKDAWMKKHGVALPTKGWELDKAGFLGDIGNLDCEVIRLQIEEETGIHVPPQAFSYLDTVGDLQSYLLGKRDGTYGTE